MKSVVASVSVPFDGTDPDGRRGQRVRTHPRHPVGH